MIKWREKNIFTRNERIFFVCLYLSRAWANKLQGVWRQYANFSEEEKRRNSRNIPEIKKIINILTYFIHYFCNTNPFVSSLDPDLETFLNLELRISGYSIYMNSIFYFYYLDLYVSLKKGVENCSCTNYTNYYTKKKKKLFDTKSSKRNTLCNVQISKGSTVNCPKISWLN